MSSLFERIGGDAAVDATGMRFYGPRSALLHRGGSGRAGILKFAFGGLPSYPAHATMRKAHERLVNDMGFRQTPTSTLS